MSQLIEVPGRSDDRSSAMVEVESVGTKSTHKVEIVPLVLEKHPNADRLMIAKVYGYTCVVAADQWVGKELAAYIPPDSLVDVSRPEFSFLAADAKSDGKARIKAKKLRGVLSFGLLVPAPDGSQVGDDVASLLGVEHYNPPTPFGSNPNRGGLFIGGESSTPPGLQFSIPKYDLESGRRYAYKVFNSGEPVVITEKIHGANGRFVYHDGIMYCGSRTDWKKEYPNYDHVTVESLVATGKVDESRAQDIVSRLSLSCKSKNMWWQALDSTPGLREFCERNPGLVVFGEVYGAVQDLNYGCKKGEVRFAAFDIMKDGVWMDFEEAYDLSVGFVPWVPVMSRGSAFDFEQACEMAEGKSVVPGSNHVREGVVVRSLTERFDPVAGRAVLKFVGAGYLDRKESGVKADAVC